VVPIEDEVGIYSQGLRQRVKDFGINLPNIVAVLTEQVDVVLSGEVVHGGVLAHVGVHDNPELLELVENSIDRTRGDVGGAGLHGGGDVFGGEVFVAQLENVENCPLGGRDPFAGLAQALEKVA
jgi:hypothetical protein